MTARVNWAYATEVVEASRSQVNESVVDCGFRRPNVPRMQPRTGACVSPLGFWSVTH